MCLVGYLQRIFILFFLITLSFVGFSQPEGYGYGKQISINAAQVMGGSPLTNFPVLVRFMGATADLNLRTFANGGHVENINGYDIIFTADQAGLTILNHQIESYNPVTGEYVAWVRIPSLSNSINTTIYMYYGNCGISINPSTTGVWNSDFDAVYRLHNDFNDATVNARTGTNTGSTDLSPALIADGQTFGMNDYVQIPSSSISLGQGTISIWAYASSFTGTQYMYGHTSSPTSFVDRIQLYVDDGVGGLDLGFGNNHSLEEGIVTLAPNVWNYIVLSWNGTTCSVYVNGVLEHTEAYAGFSALETYLDIGNDGRATGARNEGWGGGLDHARLSNEIFSNNWIQTEYNNQRTGSIFYTIGTEFNTVRTFYSRASGAWESNLSWSFSSDGSSGAVPVGVLPRRADNVVIRNGHTITVNNTSDNGSCPVSPDGLGLANVGSFISSNIAMFYQTGDMTIAGILNVTGIEMMIAGYTHILPTGTFSLASYLVNVGYLEADAASTLSTLDDFVITGNSTTIINTNSTSADDLIIDHTDATLCGTGTATLQNGGGSTITYANSATVNQVCTSFTINCTGGGCTGFPVVGTGVVITGNSGPGGVGSSLGTSALKLWFRPDNGLTVTGSSVDSWVNSAGISALDISETGAQRPTRVTGVLNGFSEISFNGSNRLRTGLNLTTSNFVNDQASSFIVARADNTTQNSSVYLTDPLEGNRFSNHLPWSGTVYYDIGNCCGNDARLDVGGLTGLTGYSIFTYDAQPTTGKQLYRNGTLLLDRPSTSTYSSHATHRFNMGGNTAGTAGFEGDVTELVIYNSRVNAAQRILIDNYLSAKYNLTLSANDVYVMDNAGNGNYDFEVAGIGQASDGSNHKDAKGSGVVRMWNPNNLGNNEFLIWGHNGLNFSGGNTTDVDNVIIQERIKRVWRISEVGDVGTTSISVDVSSTLGSALGNNLRLLIDRDGDGFADNDVTPISGSFSGGIVTFSGINLQNGDRFTIGNTDFALPLPIQLISFEAMAQQSEVKLMWSTASELNNDYFTVQRSQDGEVWQDVNSVKGAGTRNIRADYETTDGIPFRGVSYYRLKQTDFDKAYSYSQIRRVELSSEFQLKVYPNPSSGRFTVSTGFEITPDNIRLINSMGQTIPIQLQSDQSTTILTPQFIATGIYILQVNKGFWRQSVRVVIE